LDSRWSIGVSTFADDLRSQDVGVVHVNRKPPAGGDEEMLKLLKQLGLLTTECIQKLLQGKFTEVYFIWVPDRPDWRVRA